MRVHEFLTNHRDELFDLSLRHVERDAGEHGPALGAHLLSFIDEVARALREADEAGRVGGVANEDVVLDDVGRESQRRGIPLAKLVSTYTALAGAVGELGGRHRLAFGAADYGRFHRVVDAHVARAIERFAEEERAMSEHLVDERLGALAHELRNALSSASVAFGMLVRGDVSTSGPTADVVRRSHRRMAKLIEQCLLAVRIRAAAVPVLEEVRIAPLLRDLGTAAVLERGVRLAIDADESLVALADDTLLTSAVANLVQNAIKFSHDGAAVAVRARGDEARITIEVEDACGGLPPGERDALFRPFVQRDRDRRGVGLGLTIARDVMRALGGDIDVKDLPGKGCVFALRVSRSSRTAPAR